jgi:energy-coupling factor transport system substrate-specific component
MVVISNRTTQIVPEPMMPSTNLQMMRTTTIAAACVALNVGLNKLAVVMQLPVYLDTVGTILSAALIPPPYAILVGVLSNIVGGVVTHPAIPFFIGTQIVISLMAIWAFRRGYFDKLFSALLVGLAIGIASAIVSAPIVVWVFGGITAPGISALNAVLLAAGQNLWTAVLSGSILVSSVDKIITSGLTWLLLQRLPKRLK